MTVQHVVLSDREIEEIQRAEGQTNLIRQAQESDEADQKLTIRQAFKERFEVYNPVPDRKLIPAEWQPGLSNSTSVGQLAGLVVNAICQEGFGGHFHSCLRPVTLSTYIWRSHVRYRLGRLQTLSTTYASEAVPTCLRSHVTAYVCMCWEQGFLLWCLSSYLSVKGGLDVYRRSIEYK
ncbi:hypothetical protein AN1308.2 [Aspergillus nidulans FGSC A4]|uniref:Uncharacterized protein n=1 Tax=Emericella nidulans (strain FGSC A4 / ATCC 38163 / CBS 112.46 / NRRL 194 / M139) TaxID=227321 RepID=Q5BDS2_EMENI|nr:hypothetical protein [Aspergillus nidulans FGSC A4]EAA65491.1 hypothetical protein AN1308.2 [Aspergillus nidulans FGSC A4]CBF87745.1 TPA: conserved hypothetical protein [Aspergillus nidulans FGSC A4]|eukprot:XP_658912.1 hypothetical protein AN1308.2 [Aspergillus nidulans FGSC A4]